MRAMDPERPFLKNSDWLNITEEDNLWLDFTIEKTHAALYDTGKKFEKLFLTYLGLVAVAVMLAYGPSAITVANDFKVPFLELSLDRRYAAVLVVFLASCAFFSLICAGMYEETLRWRLEGLVLVRYGDLSKLGDVSDVNFWYFTYPSLFRISLFLKTYRPSFIIPLLFGVMVLFGLVFPGAVGWHVGGQLSWPTSQKTELCAGLSIMPLLIVILGVNLFPRTQAAAAVYEKLIEHFRKMPSQ
jgi:hypothetical protein